MAEVESASRGTVLRTGNMYTHHTVTQHWNIDPSHIEKNEFFVHLNSDSTLVLESPANGGGRVFINEQGNRDINGGSQVWIFEPGGADIWHLKNFKTGLYLYLDGGKPQSPGAPIIVRSDSHDQGTNKYTDWYIMPSPQF